MEGYKVGHCRKCGAVVYLVKSRCKVEIEVDREAIMIYPNDTGPDVGYTMDGRFVKGYQEEEPSPIIKYFEAHKRHECAGQLPA